MKQTILWDKDYVEYDFTELMDPETFKSHIRQGKLNHFICYLPLPNGEEEIELGHFIFDGRIDPRGKDILINFDKDDLDAEVEALEHDAPDSTPEEFWQAYDLCRVDPYKLVWELLAPETAIYIFEQRRELSKSTYEIFMEEN